MNPDEPPDDTSIIEVESRDHSLINSFTEELDNSEIALNARGRPTLPSSDPFPDRSGTSNSRSNADGDDYQHATSDQSTTSSQSPTQMQNPGPERLPRRLPECIQYLKGIFNDPLDIIGRLIEECRGITSLQFQTSVSFYHQLPSAYVFVHGLDQRLPMAGTHLNDIIHWLPYMGFFFAVRSADCYNKFQETGDPDLVLKAARFKQIFGVLYKYHDEFDGERTMTWAAGFANIQMFSPALSQEELVMMDGHISECEDAHQQLNFKWVYNNSGGVHLMRRLRAFLKKWHWDAKLQPFDFRVPHELLSAVFSSSYKWLRFPENRRVVFGEHALSDIIRDIQAVSDIVQRCFKERVSTISANELLEYGENVKLKFGAYLDYHQKFVRDRAVRRNLKVDIRDVFARNMILQNQMLEVAINSILE